MQTQEVRLYFCASIPAYIHTETQCECKSTTNSGCRLKCDRAHPCDKCSKRGQSASCTYANASSISCHEVEQARSSSGSAEVQRRLHHLENLVVTLMNDKTPDASNALLVSSLRQPSVGVSYNSEDTSGSNGTDEMVEERLREGDDKTKMLASSFGRISVERTETSYVGMCHWTAILDDVSAIHHPTNMLLCFIPVLQAYCSINHRSKRPRNFLKKTMRNKQGQTSSTQAQCPQGLPCYPWSSGISPSLTFWPRSLHGQQLIG